MKRFVIACVCLLAACAVPKGFTDKECEVIASQSGAVMRLCRIGDRADSLFLRRKAAPLGAEELKSEYFRRLKQGMPVSYTHLTLPTSDLVEASVVAGTLKKKKYREVRGGADENLTPI